MKLLAVPLFCLLLLTTNAQQRIGNFMAWSKDNGLPPSLYYAVHQSSDGYLWIGSSSGLVRFDGKRFKVFISEHENPNSPTDNVISDFAEDDKQNLWIAGFVQGVTRYSLKTGKFRRYPKLSADKMPEYGINRIFKDSEGDLWFATSGRGLAKYLPGKDTFQLFIPDRSKPFDGSNRGTNHVTGIVEDKLDHDLLWITCFDGLYSFNKRTAAFKKHPYISSWSPDGNSLFMCLEVDGNNQLWLGTWYQGLMSFDPSKNVFRTYPYHKISKNWTGYAVSDLKHVNDSLIYLASYNDGLLSFNKKTKGIVALLKTEQLPQGSSSIDIQRVSITPDAGVFAGGNYYIYQQNKAFDRLGNFVGFDEKYNVSKLTKAFLNEAVYDPYRKGYWMACIDSRAIYFFDSSLSSQQTFTCKTIDGVGYRDIALDAMKRVWAVSIFDGLMILDEASKNFVAPKNTAVDSIARLIIQVEKDSKGNLWLLRKDGLTRWDINSNKMEFFSFDEAFTKSGLRFNYGSLKVDGKNKAWVSSNMGLFHCRYETKKLEYISPANSALANMPMKSITIDKRGYLWIGYHYNGLQVLDPKTYEVVSTHTMNVGMPGMQVNTLATDNSGRIWAGFAAGLAMFDPKVKVWQLFNRNDGIKKDYIDGEVIAVSDGKILVTQPGGFIHFDEKQYKANLLPPKLHITSLKVDGKDLLYSEIHKENGIELPYKVKEVNMEFAAMDWLYPRRTKYFYLVEGIHKPNGWIPNDEASINLAGLSPGKYVVHIYAVNGDGVKSGEIQFSITVETPFWMRWWFISLCAVGFAFIIYSVYRYRIRQLKQVQNVRNNISRNLHDDIGASLSNIHILNELAKRNVSDKEKAASYLSKAGEDIQQISESLSDIVWNINPRYDDLENLFIRMKRYAADMLDGKNIVSELHFPEEIASKVTMAMDQRRDFYLIFKEAVNNLVKYSGATKAIIEVKITDHDIELMIKDNGKGFDMAQAKTGNGIQNMKQRSARWQAPLVIESTQGKGTSIHMKMKLGKVKSLKN